MGANSLRDLYISELKDLYDAEQRGAVALENMAAAARAPELRSALRRRTEQTRQHVDRLDRIFQGIGESPKGGPRRRGLESVVREANAALGKDLPPAVLDASLIAAAQRIKHYEIAGYGTARAFARRLGYQDHEQLLDEALREEGETDKRLTNLAESYINEEAKAAG